MENQDTAWHRRKEFIVPILIGLIAAIVPVVIPMNWIAILICWLFLVACIIWLILVLVSTKRARIIILVGAAIPLIIAGIYRVREQWIKDYPTPIKEATSYPIAERPKQPTDKEAQKTASQGVKSKPRMEANENKKQGVKEKAPLPPKQEKSEATVTVALRFVYPKSPALMIINQSDVVVRDIKWTVILWNMDLPERGDPLPIPVQTFDWLKAYDEGGPQNLFNSPLVAPLLKPGNRLFGSASVNCPTCTRGRTYIVYIVWGEGGWFSEVETEKSGRTLIPATVPFSRDSREKYFEALEAIVPEQARLPIKEHRFQTPGEDRLPAKTQRQMEGIKKYESETKPDNKKRLIEASEKLKKELATLGISEAELTGGADILTEAKVKRGLKGRAIFLSYQILQFLRTREHNEPDTEKKGISNEDTDNMINYFNETMTQYSSKYGDKVISIRNEFAGQKKQDKELDKYYKHPANPIEILIIAERIEALADQL
jgi:hypothetical protein